MKKWISRTLASVLVLSNLATMQLGVLPVYADDTATTTSSQLSSTEETVYINNLGGDERSINFDANWRFYLGEASGAEAMVFDDSQWESLNLPHDYSADMDYTSAGEAESGYKLGGVGWYRKGFYVDSSWSDKTITIDFGGAYMNATVYLNGVELGTHPYGYTAFSFELPQDLLDYEGENVLAVRTYNQTPSSRWYSGSGIYRSVYITATDKVHVGRYGVTLTTPDLAEGIGAVDVATVVDNDTADAASVSVIHKVLDASGAVVATSDAVYGTVAAESSATLESTALLTDFNLWSVDNPYLYTVQTEVYVDGVLSDSLDTDLGLRTIEFDRETGFYLNGEQLKLQGVCMHHDQGGLGAEAWYRAVERQVEILKEMGVNAIRVSHNPASDELIDVCNRLGMLIIDEAFDTWLMPKNGNSYDYSVWFNTTIEEGNTIIGGEAGEMVWAEYDLTTMISRGKNSPAVIAWSLGNELFEGVSGSYHSSYATWGQTLIDWIQEIDDTRPVTFGQNDSYATSYGQYLGDVVDASGGIVGRNYGSLSEMQTFYDYGYTIFASETGSTVNSRGVYDYKGGSTTTSDMRLTSYEKSYVSWGAYASESWYNTIRFDAVAGEFLWTGFDYLGEPTPWNGTGTGYVSGEGSPKSSYFGIIDTAGLPKDTYYFYQSQWNNDVTTLHILPTWDEDEIILTSGAVEVVVYSDAAMIELYLNDELVGSATATVSTSVQGSVSSTTGTGVTEGDYTYQTYSATADVDGNTFSSASGHQSMYATFNVPYEEGTLYAVAYDADGNVISDTEGRSSVTTTTGAAQLSLSVDRDVIDADGRDLAYVTIEVQDADGDFVNSAEPNIEVTVSGDGTLMALDSGSQYDYTAYTEDSRDAFSGMLVAIVQSTTEGGTFTVTATTDDLVSDSVVVTTVSEDEGSSGQITGYSLSRNHYIQVGGELEMPATATIIYDDGTTEVKSLDWDLSSVDVNVAGTYVATAAVDGLSIAVSSNVTVLEQLAAMLNYSTAILEGGILSLPTTLPVITEDGEVLSVELPVEWDTSSFDAYQLGVQEVTGQADLLGVAHTVTAWVRVAEGSIVEGVDVIGASDGLFADQDRTEESSALEAVRDGDTATTWVGTDAQFSYATAQNLYKVVLNYETLPTTEPTIQWSLEGNTWIDADAEISTSGTTVTYTLSSLVPAVWVRIAADEEITLAECEFIIGTPSFPYYSDAVISSMTVNGQVVDAISLEDMEYPTQALLVADYEITTDVNASYTVLPAYDDVVLVLVYSEDHSESNTYRILLGQDRNGNGGAADDSSNDYDYTLTTATAASAHSNYGNYEGPVEYIVDGNESTYWHTYWTDYLENSPDDRWVQLELDEAQTIEAVRYLPRPSVANGIITEYSIQVSMDGETFTEVATGEWVQDTEWKIAEFGAVEAKYVRLYGVQTQGSSGDVANRFVSGAEMRLRLATVSEDAIDISAATVTVDGSYTYTGSAFEPNGDVVVTLNGESLVYGVDYILSYTDNVDAGTATVMAEGILDYAGTAIGTFTIGDVDRIVTGYNAVEVSTYAGYAPALPATVTATMNAGSDRTLSVEWDAIDADSYAAIGSFVVYGTVTETVDLADATLVPSATVTVVGVAELEEVTALTYVGVTPNLPTNITVTLSNGSTVSAPVVWESASYTGSAGQIVTVTGTVTLAEGVTTTMTAEVQIVDTLTDTTNLALNTSYSSVDYPMALASHITTDYPYYIQDGSKGDGNTWSDWVSGSVYHDEAWAGVILSEEVTYTVDQVTVNVVHESANPGVRAPSEYRVEYYTGPDFTIENDSDYGHGVVASWTDSPLNDNDNWTEVTYVSKDEVPDFAGTSTKEYAEMTVTFAPVAATFFRVVMTPDGNNWVGFDEMEVYGIEYVAPEVSTDPAATVSVEVADMDTENGTSQFNLVLDSAENLKALYFTMEGASLADITPADDFEIWELTTGRFMLAYRQGTFDELTATDVVIATIQVAGADGAEISISNVIVSTVALQMDATVEADSASTYDAFALAAAIAEKLAEIDSAMEAYIEAAYSTANWTALVAIFEDGKTEVEAMADAAAVTAYEVSALTDAADEILTILDMYDLNGDGSISFADVTCIVAYYGYSSDEEGYIAKYDVNGNGSILSDDYLEVYANIGKGVVE